MVNSSPALLLNNEITNTGLNDSQEVNAVVVHPLVLLSILDHHTRRQDGAGRVIGTLLGRRDGDKVRFEKYISNILKVCRYDLIFYIIFLGGSYKLLCSTSRRKRRRSRDWKRL